MLPQADTPSPQETATEAGGMHSTGMHSCFNFDFDSTLHRGVTGITTTHRGGVMERQWVKVDSRTSKVQKKSI